MFTEFTICSRCSWVNKAQDQTCKACGVALYRPTSGRHDFSHVPTIPNHPLPTAPVETVQSQSQNHTTFPTQSSIPTPVSMPSILHALPFQSTAPSHRVNGIKYHSGHATTSAYPIASVVYVLPTANLPANHGASFGTQTVRPESVNNYALGFEYETSHCSHRPTNILPSFEAIQSFTTPIKLSAVRPEPVDDFASGFGRSSSKNKSSVTKVHAQLRGRQEK
jgi:hypothetical protein